MSVDMNTSTPVMAGQIRGFNVADTPLMFIIDVDTSGSGLVKYMMDGQVKSGPLYIVELYTEIIDETR